MSHWKLIAKTYFCHVNYDPKLLVICVINSHKVSTYLKSKYRCSLTVISMLANSRQPLDVKKYFFPDIAFPFRDTTILRLSYPYYRISYIGKATTLYGFFRKVHRCQRTPLVVKNISKCIRMRCVPYHFLHAHGNSMATWGTLWWNWAWWRHQMKTVSALLALCERNHRSPVDSPTKG